MSRVATYTWAAASTTAVSALQSTSSAGNLQLNGTLAVSPTSGISFGNVSRTVSLTSLNNLSAVNVTVTGTYQGAIVSQTIAGPNANTVYTTQLFDTVTSVFVSAAVNGISVGSGTTGQTQWYPYNIFSAYGAFAVEVVVAGTINYSFQTTLDPIDTSTAPFVNTGIILPNPGNVDAYTTVMSSQAASQFAWFTYPVRYANILINSATTGSLVARFLQQGII